MVEGSGKTWSLVLRCLRMMSLNAGGQCVIAEPVYPMVKDVLQPTLEKALEHVGFDYKYSASDLRYRVIWKGGWGDILLRSGENWRRLAGLNLWGFFLDEADLMKDDSCWNMGLSRLREGNVLTASACSTPEGFGWMWSKWSGDDGDVNEGYELIRGKTQDNTFLPEEFIESLEQNYDSRLLQAYMYGNWVNLQKGQTYYNFDRKRNVDERAVYNKDKEIIIGMDFNYDPCCAVLFQQYDQAPNIRAFDEVSLTGSMGELVTERVANEIKRRYPNNKYKVIPDASGKARSTSSRTSDHDILRRCGLEVRVGRRNPPVVDRVNCLNKRLESIAINPKCKVLIKDLEQVVNIDGTREIDKRNKKLTHMSDAFSYAVHKLYPLTSRNVGAMTR